MIGQTISHYKITAKLGEGGMGEVYLAEDTDLKRMVALKFLPETDSTTPETATRFRHEAQAAAALSHPNIATVHAVSEHEGRPYIVMEYVDGPTLSQYCQSGDPPIHRILELAIQIGEGLKKAHAAGVVHRDLKPANILVDRDGRPKILDFGLAKRRGATRLTKTGSTLGTAAYMSPEQSLGQNVDHRTDIWSFGVMLYEMVTSRLPFDAEYEAAIAYAIVNREPEPMARYRSGVSAGLQQIVDRALTKLPEKRYQQAEELVADLARELESTSKPSAWPAPRVTTAYRRRWVGVILSSLAVVAAVIATLLFVTQRPSRRAAPERRQLTYRGSVRFPEISPDGQYIAFVERRPSGQSNVLMVQDLAGGTPIEVFEDEQIWWPRWSPDGTELLMVAYNDSIPGVVLVPRLGGSVQRYRLTGQIAWSHKGDRFLLYDYVKNRCLMVDKETGDTVSPGIDVGAFDIDWSPNGELLAASEGIESGLVLSTCAISNRQWNRAQPPIDVAYVRWCPSGDAIYFLKPRGSETYLNPPDLMKVNVDPHSGKLHGEPRLLISGLQTGGAGFSVSGDGRKLVFRQTVRWSNLWFARRSDDADGVSDPNRLTSGTSLIYDPSISPDGTEIAFAMTVRGEMHIFTMPIAGGTPTQVTHTNAPNWSPAWSPDGKQIAYSTLDDRIQRVALIDPKGGPARIFGRSVTNFDGGTVVWSPGARILYDSVSNFHLLDAEDGTEERLMAKDLVGWGTRTRWSPDGRKVALETYEHEDAAAGQVWNKKEVAVFAVESHAKIWSMPLDESQGELIGWSQDGEWLYRWAADSAGTSVNRLRMADHQVEHVLTLPSSDVEQIAMSSDCSTFVYVVEQRQSDAWLVENFDPDVD